MKEYDMISEVVPPEIMSFVREHDYEINIRIGRSLSNSGYVYQEYVVFTIIRPSVDGDKEVFVWYGHDGGEQENLEDSFARSQL